MEYEDRLAVATPEGVDLHIVIAGLGSRFMGICVDLFFEIVLIIALGAATTSFGTAGAAAYAFGALVVFLGYPIGFELLASGRTPGKMLAGTRVVSPDGTPVRGMPSVVRNVVRLIDILPAMYTVGMISILATDRNQRLGDLAAGTLVIRDARQGRSGSIADLASGRVVADLPADAGSWDLSAVTVEEVATVRAFLERRDRLDPSARADLAGRLATRLVPKVAGPPTDQGPERFLELIVTAKAARS